MLLGQKGVEVIVYETRWALKPFLILHPSMDFTSIHVLISIIIACYQLSTPNIIDLNNFNLVDIVLTLFFPNYKKQENSIY